MEPLQLERDAVAGEHKGQSERKVWLVLQPKVKLDVLTMLRLRDQVKQHCMNYSTVAHDGQENGLYPITEQILIDSTTQNLEQDIEEVKVSLQNKTLALQRNQLTAALRNKMKQNDNESRPIMETLKHIVKLTTAVFHYQQQARENEQKLNNIKMKRLSLKEVERQKLLKIRDMKKKQKEEQVRMNMSEILEKIKDTFKKEREITTVIQHVFQNIIIASQVDWAEDASLKAVVLQLEKNVNFM